MTQFNFSYFLSMLITLITIYILHIRFSNFPNVVIYFIIPITVSYLSLLLLNLLFESTDELTDSVFDYLQNQYIENVRRTEYYYVFPPFVIFLLIFVIILYQGNFS